MLWTASGGVQDLGGFGGTISRAGGMNERGHVVGQSETPDGYPHAFRWTASTGMTDLHDASLGDMSGAEAINIRGQVVGAYDVMATGAVDAFLWSP